TPSTRTRTPTVAAPWRWSTTASSRTPARCAPRLGSAVTCSGPRPTRRCSRTWSKSCSRAPARWSKRWRARCTRSRAPTVSQWCRRGSPTRSWPRGADLRCSWPSVRGRLLEEDGTARLGGLNINDEQLLQVNRIVFTACGTSWHSALIGEYMMEELARIPSEVEYAYEFRYRNPIVDERTLVVGISQSGETADT